MGSIFFDVAHTRYLRIRASDLSSVKMTDHIQREANVHGEEWNSLHGGYFSDPAIAASLLQTVQELVETSGVDTVVDLGGGTGTLLSLLRDQLQSAKVRLVNIDDSEIQLDVARKSDLTCIKKSVDSFTRDELDTDRVLFMMRSVLHYVGKEGLEDVLRHIRAQAAPGEFFVHQTASFKRQQDADCLNELYRMMGTSKWYPTVDYLKECLVEEGWQVGEVRPAPALPLTSEELMNRYGVSAEKMEDIRVSLKKHDVPGTVLDMRDNNFTAHLHYAIYTVNR